MTLLVDELYNGITFVQKFRLKKSLSIAHIRPWVYKHGILTSGVLTLNVKEGTRLLATSTIDYTKINSEIVSTYAHGQIRFDFDSLQLNHKTTDQYTEYTLELFMNGYINSVNFIGAVRRFEDLFYPAYGDIDMSGDSVNDMIEPLGFELFEYKHQT